MVTVAGDPAGVALVAREARERGIGVYEAIDTAGDAVEQWRRNDPKTHVIVAVRDGVARRALVERFARAGATFASLPPRGRWVSACEFGAGMVALGRLNVGPRVRFGAHVWLEDGACVGHDSVAGDFVTVAAHGCVSGAVRLGDGCTVGADATVVNGTLARPLELGPGARVEPGAVVTRPVAPGATVAGNPARTLGNAEGRACAPNGDGNA